MGFFFLACNDSDAMCPGNDIIVFPLNLAAVAETPILQGPEHTVEVLGANAQP